jgi:hypothetical protein
MELEHVSLFHAEALGDLPRAHRLASSVLFMQLELLEPILGDFRLDILTLALAVLSMLLKNLPAAVCVQTQFAGRQALSHNTRSMQ